MPRKPKLGATRSSAVYPVRLPALLKEQWEAHCARKGQSQQAAIRALMQQVIEDNLPSQGRTEVACQTEGTPDGRPKRRVEVRFSPSELEEIERRSSVEGCSPQRWIVNCVRASLTHEPQVTLEVTKALWESSRQLRGIGTNLNQITKWLHEGRGVPITMELIEKLSKAVHAHTSRVAEVLDASLSRWGIERERS